MVPESHAPFARLTPDCMLDALESVDLRGDGRFLALNSYENRVYQVSLEDGRTLVAKFYRPGRWSVAQIREEHGFVAELAAREIPVVAPLPLGDARTTLGEHEGYRFAVYPRRGGRAPGVPSPSSRLLPGFVLHWRRRSRAGKSVLSEQTRPYVLRSISRLPPEAH